MIFQRFPYTTLNNINLDWIIKQVKQIAAALQGKQDKPDAAGVAGQVLGLDENLDPVWLDQTGGGGGTTNYNNLTNKPQINSVTLSGNKTAADLGLANASDIPTVPVQSVNGKTGAVELDAADVGALPSNTFIPGYSLQLPVMDGEASSGTNMSRYAMEGHRHPTDTSRASNSDIGIVQNTDTATENISKGKYVIWHGALYTASTAIASGTALSSSNLTAVTGGGLNDLCQRDEITLTYESGVTPQNFSKLYAVGKVHVLSLSIFVTKEATQANWYKVATIPDGHRPDINLYPYNFILSAYQVLIEAGTGQIAIANQSAMSNQLVRTYVAWIV